MNWRETIELNPVISEMSEKYDLDHVENDCPEEVKEKLAGEVEKSWTLKRFAPKLLKAKSIAEVNRILGNVFNEADRSKVWCGFD